MPEPSLFHSTPTDSHSERSSPRRRSLMALFVLASLMLPYVALVNAASAATNQAPHAAPEFKQPDSSWIAKKKPGKPNRDDRQERDDDDDDREERNNHGDRLSPSIVNVLRRDLSQRIGLPPGKIKAIETRRVQWPDTCLGLGQPNESCGLMIVEGWRVVLLANERRWVYRTDLNGTIYRLEQRRTNPDNNNGGNTGGLPQAIKQRVIQDAAHRTGRSVDSIRILKAEQRTWPNGCLGLPQPGEFCTQALVQGWRVLVVAGEQRLIYRTNASGSVLRLE